MVFGKLILKREEERVERGERERERERKRERLPIHLQTLFATHAWEEVFTVLEIEKKRKEIHGSFV